MIYNRNGKINHKNLLLLKGYNYRFGTGIIGKSHILYEYGHSEALPFTVSWETRGFKKNGEKDRYQSSFVNLLHVDTRRSSPVYNMSSSAMDHRGERVLNREGEREVGRYTKHNLIDRNDVLLRDYTNSISDKG